MYWIKFLYFLLFLAKSKNWQNYNQVYKRQKSKKNKTKHANPVPSAIEISKTSWDLSLLVHPETQISPPYQS